MDVLNTAMSARPEKQESSIATLKKCIIHVGVHKTGTTFFQSVFRRNIRSLRDKGIAFLPPKLIRKGFVRDCVYKGKVEAGRIWLEEHTKGCHTLLICEEKLLGKYYEISDGFPYKKSGELVGNLVRMLPEGSEIHLMVSIRDYSQYIESCYLQYLKYHVSKPYGFKKYLRKFGRESVGWRELLEQLLAFPEISKVHLWPYEMFRKNNGGVISIFESILQESISVPDFIKTKNPSFSAEALNLLQAAHGMKKSHHEKFRKWLMRRLTTSNGYQRPELMSDSIRSFWREKYSNDLGGIMGIKDARLNLYMFEDASGG